MTGAATLPPLVGPAARGDREALYAADERERYTVDEAEAAVDRIAAGLVGLGARKGDRVAFLSGGSARHLLTFLACQQLGVVPCALHLREPPARQREAIAWIEPSLVVCDAEHEAAAAEILDGDALALITLGDTRPDGAAAAVGELLRGGGEPVGAQPGPDDLALIILSSGTTGAPKGALDLQRNLHATAAAGRAVFGEIGPGSSALVAVPPSAAAWNHIVLPFLAARAAVHFVQRFDAAAYVETLARERITHAPLVPTMWLMALAALDETRCDLGSLRLAFYAGEVGSQALVDELRAKLPRAAIRTGYLSGEGGCASACVADEADLLHGKPATTGRPIAGVELRIVEPGAPIDETVRPGEEGEIVLRSPSVATGYWRDDELTRERFVDGWWRSGDLGRLDQDGCLYIVGRTDNVINSGGLKIHAEEVEAALMLHPAVTLAAVVPAPDPKWGQAVEAHVVLSDGTVTADQILAFCRERDAVASFKLPKRIVFHDALPTGPTGKLYRRALLTPAPADAPAGAPAHARR